MSKKKASNASTMTLKDFHGGYIPSDLPLPSAPGITNIRPVDRSGFDNRQGSLGNMLGRPDYRSRPNSSPAMRNLDDNKTPFLASSVHIGRNFDEDERKPLDGGSFHSRPVHVEPKPDLVSTGRLSSWQGLNSASSHVPTAKPSSYSTRVNEGSHFGVKSQNTGSNTNQAVSRSNGNAWAVNKEEVGANESSQSARSELISVSKLAHASALDKVSSGKWQTKHSGNPHADVEVIKYPEADQASHWKGGVSYKKNETREYNDVTLVKQTEKGLNLDEKICSWNDRSSGYSSPKVNQLSRNEIISGGQVVQPPVSSDVSERPKLKLLPRSKPVESFEPPAVEYKQDGNRPMDVGHTENGNEANGILNPERFGLDGAEGGNKVVERPKLNLKPRSQPIQQLDAHPERKEYSLFGGARPRELVLKERGIDDVADNHDLVQSPNRAKHDAPKSVIASETSGMQQKNRRTNRDEKHQQQERQLSPETWLKRSEQPNKITIDAPEGRHGKAASAVELAQAFSRTASDPKSADSFSEQKGNPNRSQMPFSRLLSPKPRSHINGY